MVLDVCSGHKMSFIAFSGLKNALLSSPSRLKVWTGTTKERKKRRKKEKKRRKAGGGSRTLVFFFVFNKVNKAFFAFVS